MNYEITNPDPSSLIEALRALGYNLPTAIADIVDNSITAQAKNIKINFHWAGKDSSISILDDGVGMSETELSDAMRPGSRNPLDQRERSDLGRFGLGLKTASFSQCRKLCVASKTAGGCLCVRSWDLDYVTQTKEWRLRKEPTLAAEKILGELSGENSWTLVVWNDLDRLVGNVSAHDPGAQSKFLYAADHVIEHLALTFHRFLENRVLSILINKRELKPWNPFMETHDFTYQTPEERIPLGNSEVLFKGFILPHKDHLSSEEYDLNGGPRGWNGEQGFFIYRNRRLLIHGDWLRLGSPNPLRREEQFKLARIRLDLTNSTDSEWQLDVKKSTARPPSIIRERLTDLAAAIRSQARGVFAHRGQYGPKSEPQTLERPWSPRKRNGQHVYLIDRAHPMVNGLMKKFNSAKPEIESLLRFLEETVPVQQIWLDTAEQVQGQGIPYDGVDFENLRADMRILFEYLVQSGINAESARQRLRAMEPWNRYRDLIGDL